MILSTIIAAAFYLLIEAPVGRIHKLYLQDVFKMDMFVVKIKKSGDDEKKLAAIEEEEDVEVGTERIIDTNVIEESIVNGLRRLNDASYGNNGFSASNQDLDTTRL